MKEADALMAQIRSEGTARLAAGPSVAPRALGGPVLGGSPYLVGELGPEMILPGLGSRGPVDIGSKGSMSNEDVLLGSQGTRDSFGSVGGGGITGGGMGNLNMVGGAGFRADGGPVNAGKPYVVGERGPELVVPKKTAEQEAAEDEETMRQFLGEEQYRKMQAEKANQPKPRDEEEAAQWAKWEAEKRAAEERELQEQARTFAAEQAAREVAAREHAKRQVEAEEVKRFGPPRAFVHRQARALGESIRRDPEAVKTLYGVADRFQSAADAMSKVGKAVTPKSLQLSGEELNRRLHEAEPEVLKKALEFRGTVRQPTSFTRQPSVSAFVPREDTSAKPYERPRVRRDAEVLGATRADEQPRSRLPAIYQENRRSYSDDEGNPLSENDAIQQARRKGRK